MRCPRCTEEMDRPTVDVGVWKIPCGPWACDNCHWIDGVDEQLPDARTDGLAMKGGPA